MDEVENNTFAPHLHIVYLKCILVSAAACATANRTLNKTLPGVVSFFGDRCIRNFFFYENNFPDYDKCQNAKITSHEKIWLYGISIMHL